MVAYATPWWPLTVHTIITKRVVLPILSIFLVQLIVII